MIKKVLHSILWLLLALFMIATLAFTSMESKDIMCSEVDIFYDGKQVISIDKDEVLKLAFDADAKILEKKLDQINTEVIEGQIEKHLTIENAEVYKKAKKDTGDYIGILAIKIKHREPILRVIVSSESYYLDGEGEKFPVSTKYTANVLVASGSISDQFAKESLLPFVKDIEHNPFWKAQIEQIFVSSEEDVRLIPLVGDHIIEMGDLTNHREKLLNLKAFYEQVLAQGKWNVYKQINLKYKNQVIGTKR